MEFASKDLTADQLNAIVKKIGGHDMALRLLRDELAVVEIKQPSFLSLVATTNLGAAKGKKTKACFAG